MPTGSHALMKPWLLAVILIGTCAGTLGWIVKAKVMPRFLASANEECVADWKVAMTECRTETGSWPDLANSDDFSLRMFSVKSSDGRRIGRGYLTGRPWVFTNGTPYDVYGLPLRVERTGEHLVVSSAGANRIWGDADDVTSDQAKDRFQENTLDEVRKAAEAEILRKKKK